MRRSLAVLLFLLVCLVPVDAEGLSSVHVIHVDDDWRSDPRPGDPNVGDSYENGTASHPFGAIQEAIEAAGDGATILVHGGRYFETIDLLGKRITLTGFDPNRPDAPAWPVIDGLGAGPVVSFTHGEDANCVLSGFVITGGRDQTAGAILCSAGSPTIANCLIVGNLATHPKGAVVYCADADPAFINCTISGNHASRESATIRLVNSRAVVANSIIWGNTSAAILTSGPDQPAVRYSDVAGGWQGRGCIDVDPSFASVGEWVVSQPDLTSGPDDPNAVWVMGDYHLQSHMGRYNSDGRTWMPDPVTSACIDAGDPGSPAGPEPSPNGGIVNMGVYGGTAEASKSWPDGPVYFPDANLKAAVEKELWIPDPTPIDMLGLTQLAQPNAYTRDNAVTNLAGLEYAVNLQELNLRYHGIRDISALSGLRNLHTVLLLGNYIEELSPLAGLSNLRTLDLEQNAVTSIAALAGLGNLESIGLHRNFVSDISPLANLIRLKWVDLRAIPMNQDAYSTYLPRIQANNPGVTLLYDAFFTGRLVVSSTTGGSVIRPGIGTFTYGFYAEVILEATPDPGFEFVGWSGSYSSTENPLALLMDQDYELRANFQSTANPNP